MLKRQSLIEQISDLLSQLKSHIDIMSKQGLYDVNIYAQDIICHLFNVLFEYKLVNLNQQKINTAGIDLGDRKNRIAVQVTSENTSTKIKDTIDLFNRKHLYNEYDRLVIVILGEKKKYSTVFNTEGFFVFTAKDDIIDFSDICAIIMNSDLAIQQAALDVLKEEMGNNTNENKSSGKTDITLLHRQIMARCRAKLLAAGITEEQANGIIDNDINSERYSYILEAEENGQIFLQGEFGSGKSHSIYILILKMLQSYKLDESNPLPLFANARAIIEAGSVQSWLEKQPEANKRYVFIDGCDEMSLSEAEKIVEEVQYLRALQSDDHYLLCGRPLALPGIAESTCNIRCLTEEEIIETITFITEKDKSQIRNQIMYSTEADLKETLKRPFFTLIYAVLLKRSDRIMYSSYSELINQFVNFSLSKSGADKEEIEKVLEKTAILAIDRNLGKVHISELNDYNIYKTLQKTGFLILNQDDTISFPLPIIAQWFAAKGILHEYVQIDNILNDRTRSSRWRYAFSLMFSQMTFAESIKFFSKIVIKDIGLVAEIIKLGTLNEYMQNAPSSLECGNMIRKCMEVWAEALGEVKRVLLPWSENGIKKLAIYMEGGGLTTIWANMPEADDVCVLSPREQLQWTGVQRTRSVYAQSTWPWIYTFDLIKENLKEIVKNQSLICDNDDIKIEYVWKIARSLNNKTGYLFEEAIPLESIEKYRQFRYDDLYIGRTRYRLDLFFSLVDQLYQRGIRNIHPTIPTADKDFDGCGYVWDNYTEQRLFERVVAIYQKALDAYNDYASQWFQAFSPRMRMSILMPGIFHANLKFQEKSTTGPVISWHMEAQPSFMKNSVMITRNESEEWMHDLNQMHLTFEKDIKNRPDEREWLGWSFTSGSVRCFGETPITDVVFKWLEDDLKNIGWL